MNSGDGEKIQGQSKKPIKATKIVGGVIIAVCVVALVLIFVDIYGTDLWNLSPARNLEGTWESTFDCIYYELDPFFENTRQVKVWGQFSMQLHQDGDSVSGIMDITPTSWEYLTEYHIPPVNHHFHFTGSVEGGNLTITSDDTAPWIITIRFAFTSDIMTGTISGNMIDSDQNAIVLTKQ
ncbi:MAG: hypothetical protein QHH00_00645 [Methanomassiliicoccales archaeon]|nr:hypothetical protein [Methanomassiliicoccales archaeon]